MTTVKSKQRYFRYILLFSTIFQRYILLFSTVFPRITCRFSIFLFLWLHIYIFKCIYPRYHVIPSDIKILMSLLQSQSSYSGQGATVIRHPSSPPAA